jgi:2-polyprenyl-3-methyl-5-hydroxy-6-metoxy-1,4-benzoquinol methylase
VGLSQTLPRVQHYQTRDEAITVGGNDYLIRSLKDRQQFYDHEQQAEALGISSATWSLFGVVWPSSRILAATVCMLELDAKRVLEIGCGLALSSIVLHKMGVDITASDYHPLAKEFLDNNIRRNKLFPIKFQTGNWEARNPFLGEFDLIIGSDVLYEPAHSETVSQFIDCHSNVDVDVLIVDPGRGNRASFTRKMLALGYSHRFERFDVQDQGEANCKGRILHYRRRESVEET